MSNPAKSSETVYINAIRHRIHELEGVWISNRVIRAMLTVLAPVTQKPVDPWEKYRDMKGSGE